jgi:Fe-S cluster assembly protein SufD
MTQVLTQAPDSPEVGVRGAPFFTGHDDPYVVAYAELFEQSVGRHDEPEWLHRLRRSAIDQFAQLGFPTRKNEDWHFTNVAPIRERTFTVAARTEPSVTREQIAPFLFDDEWNTLVFVNGQFAPALSQVDRTDTAYTLGTLAGCVHKGERAIERQLAGLAAYQANAFTALNTAFLQNGLFLSVPANVVVSRPIHLVYITDDSAKETLMSPRNLVLVDRHAEVTIVESYVSLTDETYFTNAVTEAYIAPGARLRHYKVQRESVAGYHVSSSYAYQQADSVYESFSFATGSDLSRTNISTVLDGEGAHATVNGLYMVGGSQTVDHQTRIEHAKANCTSHELYKGVLDGTSHGVFNGKVYVRPEAQKTDGKQSNNNLLLSDRAHVDTKPQLEIFADDVKCTHGATVGRLDTMALFYLKSRGVSAATARKLLTYAFAAEVLEELTVAPVRERLESLAFARFATEGEG